MAIPRRSRTLNVPNGRAYCQRSGSMRRAMTVVPLMLSLLVARAEMARAAQPRTLVGINTDFLNYYSPACPTIDAIKTAQRFGTVRDPGDGKAKLDENG